MKMLQKNGVLFLVAALVSFICGIILDNVSRGRVEQKRLAYLSHPSVAAALDKK